ncbi:MAG: hypothetical protein GY865_00290, partial [candidate division Zixibacteria bacterium]|nr:hypothetical protein [candidate division Zixibacteria bacterium]
MHRIFLTLFVLLVTIFTTAFARLDKSEGKIALTGNMSVSIYHENESGIPNFISGTLSNQTTSGAEVATAIKFFEGNRSAFNMKNPATDLDLKRIDIDQMGMRHLRFQQMYNEIKVIGGDLITHFSTDGVLKTVNGNYESKINLNTNVSILPDNAVNIAVSDLESFFAKGIADVPELVIFPWDDTNYLCWRFFVKTSAKMGRWEYFVNAKNGTIIFK